MKLTPVNKKLDNSIWNSIHSDVRIKTYNLTSLEVRWKIRNEILIPNRESIQEMQIRTLRNLQNEINTSK